MKMVCMHLIDFTRIRLGLKSKVLVLGLILVLSSD